MKVSVFLERRFVSTADGLYWTLAENATPFWTRYLSVFESVEVVARVRQVRTPPSKYVLASGPGIKFRPLPHYVGPLQYVRNCAAVRREVDRAVTEAEAIVLRAPGQVSSCASEAARRRERRFGVEVVGDPYDVFAPGAVVHPLRPVFRVLGARSLRMQCRDAVAVAYVTSGVLQKRYPTSGYSCSYSSIDLGQEAFVEKARSAFGGDVGIRCLFVGSLEQMYKGPDVLIDAVGRCVSAGLHLQLTILGDGRLRSRLEVTARERNLADIVRFLGHMPSAVAVRDEMRRADLFILPSRTEGLPRAMIEAMASGLPCIGTTVGGIPELLAPEDLVAPGDAAALADKIADVVRSPERMHRMSARNLAKSSEFSKGILDQRRQEFYRYVKDKTSGRREG